MIQGFDHLNVNAVNARAPSPPGDRCGPFDHVPLSCRVGIPFAQSSNDQVPYVNNFQPTPNHDPYFNTYHSSRKNHHNLSYKSDPLPFSQANAMPLSPNFQRPNFPP